VAATDIEGTSLSTAADVSRGTRYVRALALGGKPNATTAALRPPPMPAGLSIVSGDRRSGAIELCRGVARNLEAHFFLDHFRLVPFQLHVVPPESWGS